MIKRTIEISREPAYLSTRNQQLLLKREGEIIGSIPCEDIGVLVVDHPAVSYTHALFQQLLESGTAVVLCGKNHLPAGMVLPFTDHLENVTRFKQQIAAPKPLQKQLWKQIVKAKILAQAANLDTDSVAYGHLQRIALAVKSGDTSNAEAQAAKRYWQAWLMSPDHQADINFQRDADGTGINSLLNYGYAILRAAVARQIVAAGLHPALGLYHSNRSNTFCLADDLMEPLRPIVDRRVRELYFAGQIDLDRTTKAALLELLTVEVSFKETSGPLMVVLTRYVTSLVRCFSGETRQLEIPELCTSVDTVICG